MRLVSCEWLKIASRRWFLAALFLLCALNAFLSYRIGADGRERSLVPYSAYAKLMEDISAMPDEQKYTYLQEKAIEYAVYYHIEWGNTENLEELYGDRAYVYVKAHYLNGAKAVYTPYLFSEQQLYEQARDDVGRVVNYPQYLKDIDANAEKMLSVSFFAKPGTFAYRNIQKTPAAYAHLKGATPRYATSEGVLLATSGGVQDILAVLLIFILCTVLILQEKEKGLMSLTRPAKYGRGGLLGAKIAAIFLWTVIITALLCLANILTGAMVYGLGDTGRLIQSVTGFTGSILKISVLEYLALFMLSKIAANLVLAAVIILFSVVAKSILFVYGAGLILGGIEMALYLSVAPTSLFSPLKYLNLVALTRTNGLYQEYLNINLFGYPVNLVWSSALLAAALLLGVIALSVILFRRQKNLIWSSGRILSHLGKINPFGRRVSVSVLQHEAYKILITNKALLLLCALVVFQWYSCRNVTAPYDVDDQHYKGYVTQTEGPLTKASLDFLNAEFERYNELYKQQSELSGQYQRGEIDERALSALQQPIQNELASHNAFNRLKQQAQHLIQLAESRQIRGWIVYDTGYAKLFAAEGDYSGDLRQGLLLALFLVLCTAPVFASEYQKGVIFLITPTLLGGKTTMRCREAVCALLAVTAACAVYLPELMTTLRLYGAGGLSAPVQSMQALSGFPLPISIGGYLALLYAIRLAAALALTFAMLGLSILCKNVVAAIVTGLAAFVLPAAVSLLGGRFLDAWLFNAFLGGNAVREGAGLANILAMAVVSTALIAVGRRRFCGQWESI